MKKLKILFLSMLLPVLTVLISCTGCENELFNGGSDDYQDHTWEIQLNDDQKVIEQTVKGLEFQFCLLNEDSVPSTTFGEGENFYFYFTVKNTLDEKIILDHTEFFSKDFCEVFQQNTGDSLGKPFKIGTVELVMGYQFASKDEIIIKIPWDDKRENWNALHVSFSSLNKDFLPSGTYYTKFTNQFYFSKVDNEGPIKTDSLTFKINFEIK
jgi:hypothetical protein